MPLYERFIKGKDRELCIGCEILFYSIIPSKFTMSKWQNAPQFYLCYANYCNKHSDCGNRIIYSISTFSYQIVQQYIPVFSTYRVGLIKKYIPGYGLAVHKSSICSLHDFKTQICSIHTAGKKRGKCLRQITTMNYIKMLKIPTIYSTYINIT